MAQLLKQAGIPDGVFNVVHTRRPSIYMEGRAACQDAGFTGPKLLTPDTIIGTLRRSAVDIKHRALDREDATKTQPIRNAEGFGKPFRAAN